MNDEVKTKEQLILKLADLRRLNDKLAELEIESKQVEQALRESEERYLSLVENIDLGVTLIDCDFNIVTVNTAQGRMFRKPVSDFVGKKCYREFLKRGEVCPHCPGFQATANGRPDEVETEIVRDDGSRFNARFQTIPIFGADGSITGYIEIMEGITEWKRMEEEIQEHFEARIEAERKQDEATQIAARSAKMASIGVIAAGITHEINQPLSAVQVHANTLLYLIEEKKYILPAPFGKIFKEISEGINRINGIIQHMRSFWQSPDSEPMENVNLNEAIQSALSLTGRKALSHSIKLKMELTSEQVLIEANKLQVEQIIINLVTNAIHSLDKKSSPKKEILIETSVSDENVVLKIYDNGIGLPTDKYEDMFNPFYSTEKHGEGMGLGLAIVKMYADKFKGEIEARGNQEGGATFIIRFPTATKSES